MSTGSSEPDQHDNTKKHLISSHGDGKKTRQTNDQSTRSWKDYRAYLPALGARTTLSTNR